MPLKLSVGLAREFGEAASRAASVEIAMDLESGLVSEPAGLRELIRQLFESVQTSLTEELNRTDPSSTNSANGRIHGYGCQLGNGRAQQDAATEPPVRPATSSQIKAIGAFARKQRVDVKLVLQNQFHVTRLEDLSIKQARELIDTLKSSSRG